MANGNGTLSAGKWATGALTTLAFILGGFAVGGVSELRQKFGIHDASSAHGNIEERIRAIELTLSSGKRFTGYDGEIALRIDEQLAKNCLEGETQEQVLRDIDRLRQDLSSRPWFIPVVKKH